MDEKRGATSGSSTEPASISPVSFFVAFPMTFFRQVCFILCFYCNFIYGFVFLSLGCSKILQLSGEKRKGSGSEEKDELVSKHAKVRDLDSGNLCFT